MIATQNEVYWLESSNSHEEIKKAFKLKDNRADGLLIVELYPRGKSIFSTNEKDWQVMFENQPSWFDEVQDKERILDTLFNKVHSTWKSTGKIVAKLDISGLDYKVLPADLGKWATTVDCYNNQLTKLELPLATTVYCNNNQLTKLELPLATYVYCNNNQLTKLELPLATIVYCRNNQITKLELPLATIVYCRNNQITKLELPLATYVYCANNPKLKGKWAK
jgi:hypothetical protein